MMLHLIIVILSFKAAYSLQCYDCASVRNVSDCQHLTTCSSDDYCYTDTSGIGDQTMFTLGCRSREVCLSGTTTASSLSIIGRSLPNNLDCSQCCAVDSCNKHLCTTGTHVNNTDVCEDDPGFNCSKMSSVFSICTDIHHAELVCRKFCGLCPVVNGNWSPWSSWSTCSATCGISTKTRSRACDNPPPKYGGLKCIGLPSETKSCDLKSCPVRGGWSIWSSWGSCSVTCGIGLERRDRSCSNPYPEPLGEPCHGDERDDRACFVRPCADGVWSSWSTWNSCSASCLGGISKRTRNCNNPTPSTFGHDCVGNSEETKACNSFSCPAVNGHWASWTTWGSCSVTCGWGTKKRTRTCTHPAPSGYGRTCTGNSEDKEICNRDGCPTSVRLVNGSSVYEGRLEVFHNGSWGTVCDDGFSQMSASVVCKMLNIPWITPTVYLNAHFGQGSLPILLDDVRCRGTESTLFNCQHTAWGTNDCSHSEDVGLSCFPAINGHWSSWTTWGPCSVKCGRGIRKRTRTCTNPTPSGYGRACIGNSVDTETCIKSECQVRLVNGRNPYEGRLEVFHDGAWGTVCDDNFNETAATVVCRMLNLPRTTPRVYLKAHFGQGSSLPIILDDVICRGTESTVYNCQHHPWGTNNCHHDEDVGISCIPKLYVRLVGGSSYHSGRVEVSVDNSHWGTVCDDLFTNNTAKVVCRMLGYSTSNARAYTNYSQGSGHIFLDDVSCNGTENTLTNCKHNVWGKHDCTHSEDVGVVCA